MSFWRAAGLNYVQYSSICAKTVRAAMKPALAEAASKRDLSYIKKVTWAEGKPIKA